MAYEIQPFRLLDANATNATGYEGGMGNPNDYEYYVDPATRTVKRRAKQGLPAFAGTAAPTSGGEGGGFTAAPSAGSTFGTAGKAGGPSLASQNANLAMMNVGSKMGKVPGLIGLLGLGMEAFGRYGAGNNLGYVGDNLGLLDSSPLGGTQLVSDSEGNLFTQSNSQTIQDQNVANFGIEGFDPSLGGYTGQTNTNTNEGTSGSPSYGPGGFL
jgi:hypothetical protein